VRRSAALPDLPTIAEAGLAGYEVDGWYGLLAPAGTPPAIVSRFNRELAGLLATKDVKDRLLAVGIEAAASTPAEFGDRIARDMRRWAEVVKKAKIPIE
jgi:tripartite-type tricarboxylate transporter receptor subunit TctC